MKGDRETYLDAGMNDYVSKPVDPVALSEAIMRQADIATENAPTAQQHTPKTAPPRQAEYRTAPVGAAGRR
jgi:CheY-like chemotaxis protein